MTIPAEPATALNITDIVRGPIPPREENPTWPNALHMRIRRMAIAMPPAVHYYNPCEQCGYTHDGPRAFW